MSIFQILLLLSKRYFSIFDRYIFQLFFLLIFRNCQINFCVPSICLKLNHQIIVLLIKMKIDSCLIDFLLFVDMITSLSFEMMITRNENFNVFLGRNKIKDEFSVKFTILVIDVIKACVAGRRKRDSQFQYILMHSNKHNQRAVISRINYFSYQIDACSHNIKHTIY